MTLSIRDPETDRLARELAIRHGKAITEVVREALEEFAAKPTKTELASRAGRLSEVFARIDAREVPPGPSAKDIMDSLYDEDGLPT